MRSQVLHRINIAFAYLSWMTVAAGIALTQVYLSSAVISLGAALKTTVSPSFQQALSFAPLGLGGVSLSFLWWVLSFDFVILTFYAVCNDRKQGPYMLVHQRFRVAVFSLLVSTMYLMCLTALIFITTLVPLSNNQYLNFFLIVIGAAIRIGGQYLTAFSLLTDASSAHSGSVRHSHGSSQYPMAQKQFGV